MLILLGALWEPLTYGFPTPVPPFFSNGESLSAEWNQSETHKIKGKDGPHQQKQKQDCSALGPIRVWSQLQHSIFQLYIKSYKYTFGQASVNWVDATCNKRQHSQYNLSKMYSYNNVRLRALLTASVGNQRSYFSTSVYQVHQQQISINDVTTTTCLMMETWRGWSRWKFPQVDAGTGGKVEHVIGEPRIIHPLIQ